MKFQEKNTKKRNQPIWLVLFLLLSNITLGQLLEIDYSKTKREESRFRVHFIRQGIIGVSSLQHLDLSAEVFKIRYDSKKGAHVSFTVYSTQTIWRGNKVDALNTFDFIMNPIGGTANGNFFTSFSVSKTDNSNSKIGFSLGTKWVEGPPLPDFRNSTFFDNYTRVGWINQRLLAEDPLKNSSLYFWSFPHLQLHQSSEVNRKLFFNEELPALAYGYGIELGLEYNSKLKLILIGQQLINATSNSDFGKLVLRLSLAYRF